MSAIVDYNGEKMGAVEAAAYLGRKDHSGFLKAIKNGRVQIPYFRNGAHGHYIFRKVDLDDYIASRMHCIRFNRRRVKR